MEYEGILMNVTNSRPLHPLSFPVLWYIYSKLCISKLRLGFQNWLREKKVIHCITHKYLLEML